MLDKSICLQSSNRCQLKEGFYNGRTALLMNSRDIKVIFSCTLSVEVFHYELSSQELNLALGLSQKFSPTNTQAIWTTRFTSRKSRKTSTMVRIEAALL
jgi:hypothetical protein